MAALSVGRRSCARQRETAALISQNRRWYMQSKRTKSTCPATVFFFPRRAGQAVVMYGDKKKPITTWAEQREVFKNCIFPQPYPRFTFADRT